MKLILAVMSEDDAVTTSAELSKAGYLSTTVQGEGGFLRKDKRVLMIGVENLRVRDVLQYIERCSHAREELVETAPDDGFYTPPEKVRVGGAAVFVLDVDQFYRL